MYLPADEMHLIEKIRHAHNEAEAFLLIESSLHSLLSSQSPEMIQIHVRKMYQCLSSVNPLLVEDPEEWNIIQASKVHYYRMGNRYHVQIA
jgi:hypothetical protein